MVYSGFVQTTTVRLHYLDWGGQGTPLVFLAGLGSTAHIYRGLGAKLASRFRVLAMTRRGHGQSDQPAAGYDPQTLVADILALLDALRIKRPILVGHSFGGIEMAYLAQRYPERVRGMVFLDAIFPRGISAPDIPDDPIWQVIPKYPSGDSLASVEAYLNHYKRYRPDLARIWCDAIEADVLAYISVNDDGTVVDSRDNALFNNMYQEIMVRLPDYQLENIPMLAIVPDGDYHPSVPLDANDEIKNKGDSYWREAIRPWIRARTAAFRNAVKQAVVLELNSPNHHVFIDREDDTVEAIYRFIEEQII